jgi:hypothetical protein
MAAMLYKFSSKAGASIVMLGANGDEFLRLLGREPSAKGILEAADLVAALATLDAALGAPTDDAPRAAAGQGAHGAVSLRQRLWPMQELMKRAHAAQVPVLWGV